MDIHGVFGPGKASTSPRPQLDEDSDEILLVDPALFLCQGLEQARLPHGEVNLKPHVRPKNETAYWS